MRTRNRWIRCVCAAACTAPLLVMGGAAAASAVPVSAAASVSASVTPLTVRASSPGEILSLVNAERAKAGCEPLKADPRLMQAAQAHADDMAANGLTGHDGSDGSSALSRMEKAGYSPAGQSSENVSGPGFDSSKADVDGWMASERGHRAAILNCAFKETGIGTSGQFAVEVFAVSAR
ncbi:CAP domain-containing protein [Streptomyces sp. NPDC087917]|uniref:CAP domain-containing protein n=1 Tax=Streptomyces sp. NPDC087917 TaxID=3155060 RepID=UPI0034206398